MWGIVQNAPHSLKCPQALTLDKCSSKSTTNLVKGFEGFLGVILGTPPKADFLIHLTLETNFSVSKFYMALLQMRFNFQVVNK
jgi:hypothetical protein